MTDVGHDAGDAPRDIRPLLPARPGGRGIWLFAIIAALSGGLLFYALEARRSSAHVAELPDTTNTPPGAAIALPPDIRIPAVPEESGDILSRPSGTTSLVAPSTTNGGLQGMGSAWPVARAPTRFAPAIAPPTYTPPPSYVPPPPVAYGGQSMALPIGPGGPQRPAPQAGQKQDERVTATEFQNPATTVPKGTVIQAVLETALDSNRAGFARALVSRDVHGFDGTQIVIPRGSRLVGEYKADLAAGQNRALIQWQRLMRPDGIMINLDSPSADPLGRAGIKGKVNGHFFERFSGAILQSALDIGVQLAARQASRDTVVLAMPGTLSGALPGNLTPNTGITAVQRTLSVREGTSVSVFVSRDLDFSPTP